MLSGAQLCAAALVKLGEKPIDSLEQGGVPAGVAKVLYPPIRDALYSVMPWSFLTVVTALNRLPEATPEGFSYAYRSPASMLRAITLGDGRADGRAPYRIFSNREIWTDAEAPLLTYVARVDESLLPPFFDLALIDRLAADFCIPITEDAVRAASLNKIADSSLARARLADSQQNTPQVMVDDTLIAVRG
ncbi:hypothetical protein [Ferrovibrio terrae]|uniref:hypothetical protein n=1 Tax=Ferrovibrio terrae TaxID=2594003 RepID=UPI0031381B87